MQLASHSMGNCLLGQIYPQANLTFLRLVLCFCFVEVTQLFALNENYREVHNLKVSEISTIYFSFCASRGEKLINVWNILVSKVTCNGKYLCFTKLNRLCP